MSKVILDSSVFLVDYLGEELAKRSRSLLDHLQEAGAEFHAPMLLQYEMASVLRNAVQRGRLTQEDANDALAHFLQFEVTIHADRSLVRRAYDLATRHNLSTAYDAQYLAVAEHLDCEVWTADLRLYNSVHGHIAFVNWLGNYPAPSASTVP